MENVLFHPDPINQRVVNYDDVSITENTRVSYPLEHIPNAKFPSMAGHVKNIIFLTCDAFGVLPPVARLTPGQAKYHFLSGYTAKVSVMPVFLTKKYFFCFVLFLRIHIYVLLIL
jgi:phosphoenolpyruvate carboxykinase (ATP)